MPRITFQVNGRERKLAIEGSEMLADVLRVRMGLTGTKIGCNESECGACTVLIDGEPILSCNYPAVKANGKEIQTIEGLAGEEGLHPLQEAFIEHGAVQCGFCIPGQIMAAAGLLRRNPRPSEADIRRELKHNLCRCGGYPSILKAIQLAAHSLRMGQEVPKSQIKFSKQYQSVGRLAHRPDGVEKVTGKAIFADDIDFPAMLHGRVLRAGVPHAIVKRIQTEGARKLPGVEAVLTASDIPGENAHGLVRQDWPVLVGVGEKVRYEGDAIALVAAESRASASEALAKIAVEFEELPVVSDPVRAGDPDAIQVHDQGNLLKHIQVHKGDPEAGFAEADVVIEDRYHTTTTEHAYLEPECSLARPTEEGRIEVFVGSQIPYADRDQIARSLGLPNRKVRVTGTMIGGGFGGKEDIAGQIHAALLAQATNRPVKVLFDRRESFLVHPKRHATQIRVKLGARRDGTLVAAETELYGDTGAYASLGEKVMTRATTHSTGPYILTHVKADCYAMYTNNPPAGAFRGFGVTQSAFAIESLIDDLARRVGMNPVAFRRKNALRAGSLTNTGQRLDESVGLVECIDKLETQIRRFRGDEELFGSWEVDGVPERQRAWGIAAAYKNTGLGGGAPDKASAQVELYPEGRAEVRTSSAEMGQGLTTVLQLIAAEELGISPDQVQVLLSDTDLTPDGGPTTASRQTYVTGNAVRCAAGVVRQGLATTLAEKYDLPPGEVRFTEGRVILNDKRIPLGEVVALMKEEGREPRATYEYSAPETQPLGTEGAMHFAYSFAAQAAEVEVDLLTGEVTVLRVIAATDVGRAINPLGLQGQVEGGVVMGIGNALTERFIVEEGRVVTEGLSAYRIPSIQQVPEIVSIIVEDPTSEGPYGAKGVGEISSIPTTPAITNAIFNACGVRVKKLPVDQNWLALQIAKQAEVHS